MSKLYLVTANDFSYGEGYSYEICAFPDRTEAEMLKHKIEQVFQYIEQRLVKFERKHPDCYCPDYCERLLNTIKKNPKFSFLKYISFGQYSNNFESISITEIPYQETYYEYLRSIN